MFRLKPKENKFFVLFSKSSHITHEISKCLPTAISNIDDLEKILSQASKLEKEADAINDKIIDELKKTFITPLDREDLFALANMLDDYVDQVQEIIERMYVYQAKQPIDLANDLAKLIESVGSSIVTIFDLIENVQANQQELLDEVRKIVTWENQGDKLYRKGMAQLFSECKDPIEIIKWKEIYEKFEKAINRCEDSANLIEEILIESA